MTGATCLIALTLASCKAEKTDQGQPFGEEDAALSEQLAPPVLDSIPAATPNSTVAIRGTSVGKRVVIQGGSSGTVITSILPGGNFCADIDIEIGEPTNLTIYAMGEGLLSESTETVVQRDLGAPVPSSATCSGASPTDCEGPELCTNEEDDNCDGWIDICDLSCSQCSDDALEPNDFAINVPIISPGNHELMICPCREDWFALQREAGQSIVASANFTHSEMNLNMRLYRVSPSGEQGEYLAGSFSATNTEAIDFQVDSDGLYYLRIYAFGNDDVSSGSYRLSIE